MADRGFKILEAICLQGASLAASSFVVKRTQLSNVEVEESRGLATHIAHDVQRTPLGCPNIRNMSEPS